MSFGIDYAWSRPTLADMRAKGVTFVCRYLSHDATGKNLTRAEADALSAAGIWLVVVWETTAARALAGKQAGRDDALSAAQMAAQAGMPDGRPIYFAVDFDATAGQQAAVSAYMDGAAEAIGRDRVGAYAGVGPLSRLFDAGKITWGWQTYAWSAGKWDTRAHIQQYQNGVRLGTADVDYDRSMSDDFGQWKVGEVPVALTDDDKKWILANVPKAVLNQDGVIKAADGNTTNPYWTLQFHVYDINARVRALQSAVASLTGTAAPDVDESAIVAGVLAGLAPVMDPDAIAAGIASSLGDDMAGHILDALRSRLES